MEQKASRKNDGNYLIGMICLFSSMLLFAYSVYILPYLIFNWQYNLPDFFLRWVSVMHMDYHFGKFATSCIMFLIFFVPGLLLMFIANIISNNLDNHLTIGNPEAVEDLHVEKKKISEGWILTFQILGLLCFVYILVRALEWVIAK